MKLPRYFEDPATLHVGTEPNHAYFIPFKEEGMARLATGCFRNESRS